MNPNFSTQTAPRPLPTFQRQCLAQTRQYHLKALNVSSQHIFGSSTHLSTLMDLTAAHSPYRQQSVHNCHGPCVAHQPAESLQDRDTRVLLWYLLTSGEAERAPSTACDAQRSSDKTTPTPGFGVQVFGVCQSCCSSTAIDAEWHVCSTCHNVQAWRHWVLSSALRMLHHPVHTWSAEYSSSLRRAATALSTFVDWKARARDQKRAREKGLSHSTTPTHAYTPHRARPKGTVPLVMEMMHALLADKDWRRPISKSSRARSRQQQQRTVGFNTPESTPDLSEYDVYLKHLRHQAQEAVSLDECASYLIDHAELMCQIPEFVPPAGADTAKVCSVPAEATHLDKYTPRQVLAHLTRTIMRDWFVQNAGLRFDGRDHLRIPLSARKFWFGSPCCASEPFVQQLRHRAFGVGEGATTCCRRVSPAGVGTDSNQNTEPLNEPPTETTMPVQPPRVTSEPHGDKELRVSLPCNADSSCMGTYMGEVNTPLLVPSRERRKRARCSKETPSHTYNLRPRRVRQRVGHAIAPPLIVDDIVRGC